MSKLDELLAELDKRRSEHRTASYFSITHTEYDLLRSTLRERAKAEEALAYLRNVVLAFGPDDEVAMNQETWSRVHRSIVAMLAAAEGK